MPPASPALPFRQALKRNDLRDWSASAPTLLCGGSGDPTVFWLNTQLMQSYWTVNAPASHYAILDVDSAAVANDPYASEKSGFAAAKLALADAAVAQGATDQGQSAVLQAYHSTLVPPFCLAAARAFFAAQ